MVNKTREIERQQAGEVAKEFIENDMLPETVKEDVSRHLDSQEPIQALRTALEHRKGGF